MPTHSNKKSGEQFLHERNTQLQKSREVSDVTSYLRDNGETIANTPAQKLGAYINFLASEQVNDGLLTGNPESLERQIERLVIDPDEVPESYFDLQKKIAREQGLGNVDISAEQRALMVESIREDQTKSLEVWANYLTDDSNENLYPHWFKKYAFEGMLKLGAFDKKAREFKRRSKHTVAPFAELNAEALSYVYDAIDSTVINTGSFDDDTAAELASAGNFGKLYAHAFMEVTPASLEQRKTTRGSWKKYQQIEGSYDPYYDEQADGEYVDEQGVVDDETARALAGSLQGHGTGWCTAGVRTAASQLSGGDFYVYYSQDEQGKDTIPRIAVRMEDGKVAEVRGIEHAQNLEDSMAGILDEKLAELPGGDRYKAKLADMQRLTAIDAQLAADGELSPEDLRWLRFNTIEGFGYDSDPRVEEILDMRDTRSDIEVLIGHFSQENIVQYAIDTLEGAGRFEAINNIYVLAECVDLFDGLPPEQNALLRTTIKAQLERHITHDEDVLLYAEALLYLGEPFDSVLLAAPIDRLPFDIIQQLDATIANVDENVLKEINHTDPRRAIPYLASIKGNEALLHQASRVINVLGHVQNVAYYLPQLRAVGFVADPNFLAQRLAKLHSSEAFETDYVQNLLDAGVDHKLLKELLADRPDDAISNITILTDNGMYFNNIDEIIDGVDYYGRYDLIEKFALLQKAGADRDRLLARIEKLCDSDDTRAIRMLRNAGVDDSWIVANILEQ